MGGWYSRANGVITKAAAYDYKGQDRFEETFADALRYTFDSYVINVAKTRSEKQITVSIVINHSYLGSMIYNYFFSYNLDEEERADRTYKQIVEIVKDVLDRFIDEQIPANLMHSYIRKRIMRLDTKGSMKTNIPHLNYAFDLDFDADWRKNIYGPRYPEHTELSFEQEGM